MLSEPYQNFLEGLTATFMPPHHKPSDIESRMWKGPRGSPENVGAGLRASHPCVRTNPVTGWKYVYAFGHHLEGFDGLADNESRVIKDHIERLVTENPHLQVCSTIETLLDHYYTDLGNYSFDSGGTRKTWSYGITEAYTM